MARSPLSARYNAWWTRRASSSSCNRWRRVVVVFGLATGFAALLVWHNADPAGFRAEFGRLGLESAAVWGLRIAAVGMAGAMVLLMLPRRRRISDAIPLYARRLRTHPFDHAARHGRPDELAELGGLWDTRVEHWRRRAAEPLAWSEHSLYQVLDPVASTLTQLGLTWMVLIMWLPELIAPGHRVIPSWASTLFWVAYVGALLVSITRLHRARRAATEAIRQVRCPDCAYDLVGSPAAFAEKRIGPRRCPECGSPWPLVPPVNIGAECGAEPVSES
jgi:hypothetical protein